MNDEVNTIISEIYEEISGDLSNMDEEVKKELENNFKDEIIDIIELVNKAKEDNKLDLSEIISIVIQLCELIEWTIEVNGKLTDDEIKEFAVSAIKRIYFDENCLNNPDIPYVPEFVEGYIEDLLFDSIVPGAIKYLVVFKEKNKDSNKE